MDLIMQRMGTPQKEHWPEMNTLPYAGELLPRKVY